MYPGLSSVTTAPCLPSEVRVRAMPRGAVLETRWHPSLLALSCAISLLGTFTTGA